MSGFKFHGRRVAEPKPRVRTSGLDPPDELRSAWQDMEKAKSALRRAEFRVAEHDLPGAESSDLSMPAVAVDRVPLAYSMTTTALLDDLRAGEFSESMKPVKKSRKVSRLEEKSRDINAPPPAEAAHNRSPLREPNTQDPLKLTLKPFVDDTIDSLQWRADSAESFDCDTTRSTAIRDTRVNFLNERPLPEQRHGGARGAKSGESHKPKLVSVDVHVPGQKSRKDSKKKLKKTFKDIEDKEGGLLKVKELIMKQRRQISDKGSTESLAKPPPISDPLPQKPVHREDDPVLMNVERPKLNQAVRKVASGPALPTYRGFSTTENRLENDHMLRHTDAMLQQQYAPVKDKKRRVVSMQQKVAKIEHQKPARIIAPMKKPSKYDQKEIITTSSWRAGQKLVQDKFGPLTKPALDSPPTKDVGPDLGHNGSYLEDKPPTRNVDRHANLPVSAKTILADMKSDDEEHEMKPHDVTRTITGVKRSAKSAADVESAHDKKLMKVRHYVSSDVRRYMNSKRAERKKQIQEAELARRKAEDIRRQQLDELQRKQKLRAKSHSRERKSREHSERGESDKENRLGRDDASTDSGTLTDHSSRKSIDLHEGDDIFAAAPAAQPGIAEKSQRTEPKVPERVAPNTSGVNTQALPGEGLTVESIINKYRCETGMTVDDVVAKYAKQAASIKASYSKKHRGVKNFGSFLPAARPYTAPSEMALAQSRAERIAAIKSTATSLSSRLAAETLRITRDSGVPTDAWEESSEPLGRYQRLNALHNEPGVFSSGLPGAGDVHREFHQQTERHYRNVAATKIQAVYRGHSVRQGLTWQLPGHDVVLPERTSNITEKYGFAEDLGEDLLSNSFVSDDPSVAPVQIALKGSSTEPNISSFGMAPKQPARSYSTWSDDARGDRYSVLNVFARKHGRLDLPASNVRSAADSLRCASPVSTASGDTLSSKHSDAQGYSYEEDFTAASHPSAVTKTHSSLRFSTQQKLSADEVSEEDISRKDDDTLESLSPSITSRDDDNDSIDARQLSVADEDLSRSLVLSSKKQLSDDLSEVSSLADEASESSRQDDIYAQIPKKHTVASRLAPSALEGRMTMELNLLESMEESMRQITEMERTRAIALAQQETVSLAQILKARQQTHSRELTELQLKTQQENQEASRQLEEARYRAAESAQNAAATIAQVRQENNSSLHESSKKLIASQAEAAKATANAAKQLAEAQLAIMNPPPVVVQIPETQLRESVASALQDELSRHVGIPVKEDRAAQYSHHSIAHLSRSHRDSSSRMTDISYASDTFDAETSLGKSGRRSELRDTRESSMRSVVTASDSSIRRDHTSSVQTESGVPTGTAKTDSITEDIPSERDYDLDTSATEDELEKSLRSVLPSEMQRKRLKSESLIEDSMAASFSSDDFNNMLVAADSGSASPNRRLSFEGDSFSRFTVEMVRQYMQEEEIRAQHQSTLLKLRELALREKTKAELAWLEQQKRQMRSKGADDKYPAYKKRQKMIIRRLQHQQEEIKRLREVQKAASKERQLLLLQFQEISKMRQSTKQIARHLVKSDYERAKRWLQKSQTDCSVFSDSASVSSSEVRNRLKLRPSLDITTDDESTLLHLDDSIASPTHASPAKADRSDLEALRPQSPDANIELKLKKLDEKFLTIREQELQKRKQRLSKEKHEPVKDDEKDNRPLKQLGKRERERRKEEARTPRTADSSISTDLASDALDRVDTARTAKSISTISEEIATELSSKPSEDSIQEDIKSRSEKKSSHKSYRTQDSSDETIINSSANESYSNEFDTATETAQQANAKSAEAAAAKKKPVSSASPTETRLSRVAKEKGLNVKASSLVTQRNNRRGESGSESEDSFSLNFSETPSDASDYENRIKLLNDELHRRKVEAEDLKKEQKKRRRDRLKEKEAALSQQIAAYDDYIIQVKHEMDGDVTPVRVKPQRLESLRQPDVTVLADASSILSPDHLPRSISQGQTTTSTPKESVSHKDTVSEEEIPIDAAVSDNSESQALDFRLKLDETPQVEEKAAHTARSIPEIPESEAATPLEPSVSTRSEHFTDDFESEKSERSESSSQSYTSSSQQRSRSTSATSTETESDRRTEVSSSTKVSVHTEEDISEHLSAASEDEASGIVFDLNTTEQSKPTDKEDQLQDFTIGDRVTVGGVQAGTLMFKGSTMFMPGFWAGVALDKPEGRNNGSKDGVEYFKCPAMHGLFAPPDKIARLIEEVEEDDASSEHTITEDVPDHAPLKESDDEEDSEQISESKNSMTDDAATDSELERVISSAAAAVEGFELKDEETDGTVSIEEPFKDDLNNKEKEEEVEVKKSPPPVPKKPDQKLTDRAMYVNNTADNAVQNMLNEAISQMIKIRSKKAQTPPKEPKEEEKQEEKREEKKVQNEEESGFRGGSNFMQSLDLEIPSERRKGNSDATALDFTGATPTVIKQDDLDRMYEELMTLTGDEDEYWEDDDEMGFGGNARKRPPAYQEKSPDNTGLNKAELRLDLRKLNEELIYAVPNQKEQLVPLIHNTAEVFWERRRYGEAWDSTVQPPQDFFDAAEDQGADMESRSKKVYKRMVFDLTAEVLRDLYKDEGHSEESFWPQFRTQRAWPVRERTPPTTLQALKPVLESRVLKVLHRADPAKEGAPSRRLKTWSSRKKKDHVDQILVQELRHEEPDWINYDDDELAVKIQLSDALFDSLLCETGQVISRIQQKRSNHR